MRGPEVAAIYSLPTAAMRFCGSNESSSIIKAYLDRLADIREERLKKTLEELVAAYAYYQLIAQTNKINDPFDSHVVEAYWLGNELLENVDRDGMKELIISKFGASNLLGQQKALEKARSIPSGVLPHHSFHVLFLGSVTGRVNFFQTRVLDLCLVRWGRINRTERNNQGRKVWVKYSPLKEENGHFSLSESESDLRINWPIFLPTAEIGDWVSYHWAQGCQILNEEQLTKLKTYTQRNIEAINERCR